MTIPLDAIQAAGVRAGDELKVEVDRAGRIVLSSAARTADRRCAIEETSGCLPGVYEPASLDRLRGEWR